jgi:hypothetical protein
MFSLDDLLEKIGRGGDRKGRECYREDMATLKKASPEEINKLFPNVTLSDSKEIIYAPFRLCHSLPKVNMRGRAFTPKVLSNSFASVRDAAINIDHQMKYRQQGGNDTICGHVVCGRFDPEGVYKDEMASKVKFPQAPIPILALAAFHLRSQHIPSVLNEHLSGQRKWLTSMECAHNWDEAAFWYRGDIIPIKDADSKMREGVEKFAVRPYKGHEVSLLLGGECGSVDFHSAALTPDPADDDAGIVAFVTKDQYLEAANTVEGKNIFFFPLESKTFINPPDFKEEEITVDEMANISVLGKCDPADDGHAHDLLSDGTVMSHGGHTHRLSNFNISRGSNPRLTGRTDSHYTTVSDGMERKSHEHLHTVNIPLRGKSGTKSDGTKADATANLPPQEPTFVPVPFTPEFPMEKIFDRMLAVLAQGKFEGAASTEVASLTNEIKKAGQDDYMKKLVATEVANQIAAGDLIKKEDHEKKLADAAKAEADKAEAARKESEARAARREKVSVLGFKMDDIFDESMKDVTVGKYVDSFGLDAAGEQNFTVALKTLETVKKLSEQPAATATTVETQAANKGEKKPTDKKGDEKANTGRKPVLNIVGRGGDSEGEEIAKTGDEKPVGRKAIFKTAI